MEMTSYTVTEDEGAMVKVCAIVHSTNHSCPIQFPFTITGLSTINGTAGKKYILRSYNKNNLMMIAVSSEDYVAVTTLPLVFDMCQKRSCVNLSIVNDDVLEMVESFTVSLGNSNPTNTIQTEDRFAHLTSSISIDPATAIINIIDSDGGDCTDVNTKSLD